MKKIFLYIFIISPIIFFSSCFKKQANEELKTQQILSYINDLRLDFDTLNSGILLHYTFRGIGKNFTQGQTVKLVFSGLYLDPKNGNNNGYFAKNDTFSFYIGNREILKGWNDLITHFAPGGVGIAIFPYNKAYSNNHTPNIPANCSLVYFFRILSNNYKIDQTSRFWQYAQQYDSIMNIYGDSLIYVKYFDGLGPAVSSSGIPVDMQLYTISDSLVFESDSFWINFNDPSLTEGLLEGTLLMSKGEMGKIIVPPSLSYTSENSFNIKPYTALYYVVRIIASNKDYEQKSEINKYLYVNNVSPDSILASGIYYFKDRQGIGQSPDYNTSVSLSDSLYIINHKYPVQSCQNCVKILNTSNFTLGEINAIELLKPGGSGIFILPYSQAYGSAGFGVIPPYATLIYKVKLLSNK